MLTFLSVFQQHTRAPGEAAAPPDHPRTGREGEARDCSGETGNRTAAPGTGTDGEGEAGKGTDAHRAREEEGAGPDPAREGGAAAPARAAALRAGAALCHEETL